MTHTANDPTVHLSPQLGIPDPAERWARWPQYGASLGKYPSACLRRPGNCPSGVGDPPMLDPTVAPRIQECG